MIRDTIDQLRSAMTRDVANFRRLMTRPPATFDFRQHTDDYRMKCGLERFTDKNYKPLPPSYAEISYEPVYMIQDEVGVNVPPELAEKYRKMAAETLDKHIKWYCGVSVMNNGDIIKWDARK